MTAVPPINAGQRLNQLILSLYQEITDIVMSPFWILNEGILDTYFETVRNLQLNGQSGIPLGLLTMYLSKAEVMIDEMHQYVEQRNRARQNLNEYDYVKLSNLMSSSSSIGAKMVRKACDELHRALDNNGREGSIRALDTLREAFNIVRSKFEMIIQLEEARRAAEDFQQQSASPPPSSASSSSSGVV